VIFKVAVDGQINSGSAPSYQRPSDLLPLDLLARISLEESLRWTQENLGNLMLGHPLVGRLPIRRHDTTGNPIEMLVLSYRSHRSAKWDSIHAIDNVDPDWKKTKRQVFMVDKEVVRTGDGKSIHLLQPTFIQERDE
jgi:hypothetical protein